MMGLNHNVLLRQHAYINGEWVNAQQQKQFDVCDPASGEVLACVPDMGRVETEQAIMAAHVAWPAWRAKTAAERGRILQKWAALMWTHQDDLAKLLTAEQGKPLAEARGEVAYGISFIEWFAEEGKRAYGTVIPSPVLDKRIVVMRESVGVCAAITPWNFPVAMVTRKAAAALAAGCTMVLKPAEQTPLSALAIAYLAQEAGVPAGVLNVVTGDAMSIGETLTSSSWVRKLSFTGSTEVGRLLMAQCAPTLKRMSLELGGNAPCLIFDDADIDQAVQGVMAAKFRNAGQTCVCVNRIFVHEHVYARFVQALSEAVAALIVGPGDQLGVTQGPLIDEPAVQKIEDLLHDAIAQGADVLCGGQRHILGGTFFEPTIVGDVHPNMRLFQEEIFGPVAALIRFSDESDVVRWANHSEYGLAAYVFSQNLSRVWRVAEALEYGMVAINTGVFSNEVSPFGGIKQSGMGREGSRYGLEEYMSMKSICLAV